MLHNPLLPSGTNTLVRNSPEAYFVRIITIAVNAVFIIATLYFFFNIIFSGISFMTAGGDKNSLQQAKDKLVNNILGIIIVLGTYVIITFVTALFGVNLLSLDLGILRL